MANWIVVPNKNYDGTPQGVDFNTKSETWDNIRDAEQQRRKEPENTDTVPTRTVKIKNKDISEVIQRFEHMKPKVEDIKG